MSKPAANPFKQALREKRAQIGLWLSAASPYLSEVSATAGFDWLLIDGEHAPNTLQTTLQQLQVVAPYRSQPVVRAVEGQVALVKQLLDIGAQNLLIPMVDTAEQAELMARAVQYPPKGIRGVGSAIARASRWSLRADYLDVADDEICLLVQAESVTALTNLSAIAAVEGVDGVFIGPGDLSTSLGYLGQQGHPEVVSTIEAAVARIVKAGKQAGILTPSEELARRYIAAGTRFTAVGSDMGLLARSSEALAARFRA